jgi:hypothetical protein
MFENRVLRGTFSFKVKRSKREMREELYNEFKVRMLIFWVNRNKEFYFQSAKY